MPKSRPTRACSSDPISKYLAARPHFVPSLVTLRHAASRMAAYRLHHLPVMEGARVAGLVRESDLHILERCGELSFDTTTVAEIMSFDVHFAHPFTSLGDVVRDMQRGRYDHTVVLDRERLVGIFTSADALALLTSELAATAEQTQGAYLVGSI